MRAFLMVGLLVACTSNLPPASSRWPNHRREHDERLDRLEQQKLHNRVKELERRVHELEDKVSTAPPPATPAPPPAGSEEDPPSR